MYIMEAINISALISSGVQGIFFVLLLIFAIHTIFLAYHWFSYGTSRHTSLIALAVYLCGGAVLFITLSLALRAL